MYGNIEALKASPKCQEKFPGRFSMADTLWTCPKSHIDGQNHKNTCFRRAIFHKRTSRRATWAHCFRVFFLDFLHLTEIFYTCAAGGTGDKLQVYSLILYWSGVSLGLKAGQAASHLPGPWTCGTMHIQTFGVRISQITLQVKCIAMDSNETMFVTGSADGDIKVGPLFWSFHLYKHGRKCQVWDLTSQRAIQSYPQEHSRHGLFKNISQGVAQVWFCNDVIDIQNVC